MKRHESVRDVLILQDGSLCFVTAVDSCGGIGEKQNDALFAPPEIAGYYAARTVLLEVLATGAAPEFASITVCNEPETADRLSVGINKAFDWLGGIPSVISTEKNMPTSMTALGISLTGVCNLDVLRIGKCRAGDVLYCAGLPLVGLEILEPGAEIFNFQHMGSLLSNSCVGSILPVGSRGIAAEAKVLAAESSLEAELDTDCGIDLGKSAGPSSCVLFSARLGTCSFDFTFRIIGRLK
jgi:hypothetical protein